MGAIVIPLFIGLIVIWGIVKKVNVYEAFVEGAGEGLKVAARVLPYLAAILIAIAVFRASGAFDYIGAALSPALKFLGVPAEVLPMAVIKPFSGSATLSALSDIFATCGPDSYAGVLASVMMGSSETIFYTASLYAGAAGIKDLRYTIPAALFAMLVGYVMSVVICGLFY